MDQQQICLAFIIFIGVAFCYEPFKIPELDIEAFEPRGLRISIPAKEGIEVFAFHGKINEEITQIEQGDLEQYVNKPSSNRFVYIDPDIRLKKGDTIYYWIYVQHNQLGFREYDQKYTIQKLSPIQDLQKGASGAKCDTISVTKSDSSEKFCPGDIIIDYRFSAEPIDPKIWSTEHYISLDPDWAFHVYKKDMVKITNSVLNIQPKIVIENAQKKIDLRTECTQKGFCLRDPIATWNPPAVSGRIHSVTKYAFINVTVRAKLPVGDYIYPEIYLEDPDEHKRRILVAYARGNKNYVQKTTKKDEGGSLLYGGPYKNVVEPARTKNLATYRYNEHIGNQWHTFNMIWKQNAIDLFIDGEKYGQIKEQALKETGFNEGKLVRMVFGVGVGGPYEFPDGYTSSGKPKPFGSTERDAVKNFVNNIDEVVKTWSDDKSKLEVEYVTITAI
ncbi:unnamed protein product [Ceutorhynchus assimilis]|uniref:Uncharacterized protein n=1 Tax=Ceutorhynchus assimilis TaxID=467358 RepID=A0A9P0GJ54_9CUCU|nr:unnamed protein product [Ceutorhynchus assimilis]